MKKRRKDKVDLEAGWAAGWHRRRFRELIKRREFQGLVTLARLANMLRFVQSVVVSSKGKGPEQRRQSMNSFYLAGALLVEAEHTISMTAEEERHRQYDRSTEAVKRLRLFKINRYALKWKIIGNVLRFRDWSLAKDPLIVFAITLSAAIVWLIVIVSTDKANHWASGVLQDAVVLLVSVFVLEMYLGYHKRRPLDALTHSALFNPLHEAHRMVDRTAKAYLDSNTSPQTLQALHDGWQRASRDLERRLRYIVFDLGPELRSKLPAVESLLSDLAEMDLKGDRVDVGHRMWLMHATIRDISKKMYPDYMQSIEATERQLKRLEQHLLPGAVGWKVFHVRKFAPPPGWIEDPPPDLLERIEEARERALKHVVSRTRRFVRVAMIAVILWAIAVLYWTSVPR